MPLAAKRTYDHTSIIDLYVFLLYNHVLQIEKKAHPTNHIIQNLHRFEIWKLGQFRWKFPSKTHGLESSVFIYNKCKKLITNEEKIKRLNEEKRFKLTLTIL